MFLGGVEGDTSSEYSATFTNRDIETLSGTADILITALAPANVANLSAKAFLKGSKPIATLVQKIKPRYHFSAEGLFYEREPYNNGNGYTRFLSLGNVKEERWTYAFKINLNSTNMEKPAGATESPFKPREFKIDDRTCRVCGDPDHLSYDCPQKPKKRKRRIIGRNIP
jgi:Zinc knuckle